MEFRRLGTSGMFVSEIAYGNWLTHGLQVDDQTARRSIGAALDAGITTFDTADMYADTRAEEVLGRALSGIRRESVEICTKVYWPTGPGRNDRGLSRKHIMESAHASLRRLRTDHIDLYQAHRWDFLTPIEETMRAFDDLVRQGKVLYLGFSEWTAANIEEAQRLASELGLTRFVSSQPQYSLLWRVIEAEVVPACEATGVSQIVWSPLAQGVLTGKYRPGQPVPADSRAANPAVGGFMTPFLREEVLEAVARLAPIAADLGLTMAQLATAWVLQNPNVASAIVGASRPEQVTQAAGAAGVRLAAKTMAAIEAAVGGVAERDPARTRDSSPYPRA